jgi:hypothetical protein
MLHPKARQLVAVPDNRLNRPNPLLLNQTPRQDLLLLMHPQKGHASNVDRLDIMPTTVPTGLLIPLQLQLSKVMSQEVRVRPYLSIGDKSTMWKQKLNPKNPKTRKRCRLKVKKLMKKENEQQD